MPYFLFVLAETANIVSNEAPKSSDWGDGAKSIIKMIGLIILCILIIAASYYTTKFVGKRQIQGGAKSNIKSIDVFRITPNKYLQIVEVGKRYFCIAVTKESVTLISELSEDDLKVLPAEMKPKSFKEQMNELMHRKNASGTGSSELGEIAKLTLKSEDETVSDAEDTPEDTLTTDDSTDVK